jgi:hypothetical protein
MVGDLVQVRLVAPTHGGNLRVRVPLVDRNEFGPEA